MEEEGKADTGHGWVIKMGRKRRGSQLSGRWKRREGKEVVQLGEVGREELSTERRGGQKERGWVLSENAEKLRR